MNEVAVEAPVPVLKRMNENERKGDGGGPEDRRHVPAGVKIGGEAIHEVVKSGGRSSHRVDDFPEIGGRLAHVVLVGAEAVFELEVHNLQAVVINDIYGNDLYEQGRAAYQIK
jgi:hypothetical protein